MATKMYGGSTVEVTEEGYMVNMNEWSREIAIEIAKEQGIELTDKHFELMDYLRTKQAAGETLTIRAVGKSGIVDIKGFYELFPGGPLKLGTKIAGLPKPTSCV
ncbi:MAG: sulfur relay protein DsrC [Bacteroidetes bacterium HGW-Bacteroidetes-6]|jgi:tRNA 2-thiouridine synthesizing protein E|nr:MAG: sulfur relay protein DsrC [Bacteroidetes bacterium HGW-Bacteroidetes-6]